MTADNFAVIVLASGLSKRFGTTDKLLVRLNGQPVLSSVADYLSTINFGKRFAVTPEAGPVHSLMAGYGFQCVANTAPELGQGRSLALGVSAAISAGFKRAIIVLGDMPFVGSQHVRAMIEMSEQPEMLMSDLIVSEADGVRCPPSLVRGQALRKLAQSRGNRGAKGLLDVDSAPTLAMSVRDAKDIDTPNDLLGFQ